MHRADRTLMSILTLLLLITPALGQSSSPAQNYTPSEVHDILARHKAETLEKARRAQALALAESPNGQTNYDVTFYDVSIRVDDTTEFLYGTVKFVAQATEDGVTVVDFDLLSSMSVDAVTAPSGALAFTRTGDFVSVTLDDTYDTGEQFEFDVEYSGTPPTGGLKAFSWDWYDGHRSISSLSEPYFARNWWPCKDRMDDKPDSLKSHLEVADEFYCASNGVLDSTTAESSNSHAYHYSVRYPMATYLFSVAIAPFTVWQQTYTALDGLTTMPVIHHVYPSRYSYSLTTWNATPDMIATLAGVYGEYPFLDEKYGHANFEWGGAMEHQTVTSMTGSTFGFYWSVIVHELSHQWWGDMITCASWHDIWLNEGWATYSEALYQLETSGWPAYHDYMDDLAYYGTGTVYVYDTTDVGRIFNTGLSYHKGAWVVHMLRGVLGEELFAQGLEAYYNSEFQYKAATTVDFENVWEQATGQDLTWFFSDWIHGERYPAYSYCYMSEPADGGGYDHYLIIDQNQATYPQVFHMPVDVYFAHPSEPGDTLTLMCDERRSRFKLNFDHEVPSIALDPAGWILKSTTSREWIFYIVTFDDQLATGTRLEEYADTVETRGSSNTSFEVEEGSLPPGLSIDDDGVISGLPTETGVFSFRIGATDLDTYRSDRLDYTIEIVPGDYCCVGKVGDANGEGGDEPTISDVSELIDLLFISGQPIDCYPEGDINQSGGYFPVKDDITIGDISVLIDHLFITKQELPDCF